MNDAAQDLVIFKLDRAKQALAEAQTIQQTKQILDIAHTAEILAKRRQLSEDAIAYAHAVKLEALRLLGQQLRQMPKAKGGQPYQARATGSKSEPVDTLADLCISKKTSMMAQRLAELTPAQFEQVRDGMASMAQVMRAVNRATSTTITWSLDSMEQRLLAFINREIEDAPPGSQPHIADLLRRIAAELDEADRPELHDSAAIARDELDLRDAEPGGNRIFESEEQASTHPGSPNCIASCKSTYPDWYKDLTTKRDDITPLKRTQIEARLDDIGQGKLPTARTARTHFAVLLAIKDLPRTSSLGRWGS